MEIDRDKLQRARRVLGARTDTETVDQALSLVIANQEIEQAINETFGSVPDFRVRLARVAPLP